MGTTMQKRVGSTSLPKIKVSAEHHDRLVGLAAAAVDPMPEAAGYLADELDRAQIVRPGKTAHAFVGMGYQVEFRDDATGEVQTVAARPSRSAVPVQALAPTSSSSMT